MNDIDSLGLEEFLSLTEDQLNELILKTLREAAAQ